MIRFICIAVFLILYLILSIPVFLVEWIIGKFNRRAKDISSLRIVQWGFKVILKMTGVTTTVIGEENVPDEPVLFIGNHRSYFDILLTYSRCRRLTGYVAKKEMEKIPLLSTWMKNLYCLFLDRDNMREGLKTILQAIDYVKNGISICIFPEGTRNNGEELSMLPFPRIKKTHVILEYGKPIYPKELDKETRKHLGIYCHDLIQDTIKKNASLV
ncbi:MAG: 1-acyl-sn-glycerol-3-phosphate acyltransferase [Coprococcus sp. 43_8]|nr:MAG: 1-acyl-sn-glycerol-3-phosphate acyltransferase [Coprococcus sp. 43_8]